MTKYYIIIDGRTGKFRKKRRGFTANCWVDKKEDADLYKGTGAVKRAMYSYNINPDRGKMGAKIILPDWVQIKEVKVNLP